MKNYTFGQQFTLPSPLGSLEITLKGDALSCLKFSNDVKGESPLETVTHNKLPDIVNQLANYLCGRRKVFDVTTLPEGTEFQKSVWKKIAQIPYGKTTSYGMIAEKLGDSNKVRAVGRAVGANPIPLIIPCHRVVGADGSLTGFSGGLWRKKWLLQHEGITLL